MIDRRAVVRAARAVMRGPLVRASRDCLFDAAAVSLALFDRDPLACWRPEYADEGGALALADRRGGILAASDATFTAAGMVRANAPAPGDLGLVAVAVPPIWATYAVWVGRGWVTRGPSGPVFFQGNALGVWTWG